MVGGGGGLESPCTKLAGRMLVIVSICSMNFYDCNVDLKEIMHILGATRQALQNLRFWKESLKLWNNLGNMSRQVATIKESSLPWSTKNLKNGLNLTRGKMISIDKEN